MILEALTQLDYSKEASAIESKWKELNASGGHKTNADYQQCFPHKVLAKFATEALEGYKAMNCRCSTKDSGCRVHDFLNKAWAKFWRSPVDFAKWEQATRAKLLLSRTI